MSDDVRYVLILQIEKIIKKSKSASSYNTTNTASEDLRQKYDVAKVAISDTDLNRLIARGGQHLALVEDQETEVK